MDIIGGEENSVGKEIGYNSHVHSKNLMASYLEHMNIILEII